MGVESETTGRASRNRIGACTRGPASLAELAVRVDWVRNLFVLPWLARPFGLPNGRVSADGSAGRTDDGRVVRNFKPKPTAREV